jgi:carboxyl-terminal processing protease
VNYDGNTGTNVNFLINAYANSNTITMTLEKPDGSRFDVSMSTGTYTVNPVLATKVIDAGGGKK